MRDEINTTSDVLKSFTDARLSVGHRWLVVADNTFEVYERLPYSKRTTTIIETDSEVEAVRALVADSTTNNWTS